MTNTNYEFVDMMEHVHVSNIKLRYNAGHQIDLLQDAFQVEWVLLEMDDAYHGEWYGIFKMNEKYHLLNGYFGSCSSCDDLEDTNPLEWLETYVKNVRAFDTIESAIQWLFQTEDFSYSSHVKNAMIGALLSIA